MCMIPLWKAALLNFHVMYPEPALSHVTRSYRALKSRHMFFRAFFRLILFFFKRPFDPHYGGCRKLPIAQIKAE